MDNSASDIVVNEQNSLNQVGQELGLKNLGEVKANQNSVERIMEWAREKGAATDAEIVTFIKELAGRVGSPTIGSNWAKHLSTYAYLELDKLRIEKQLKNMEKHGR